MKNEVGREPLGVSIDLLIQALRCHSIDRGEV